MERTDPKGICQIFFWHDKNRIDFARTAGLWPNYKDLAFYKQRHKFKLMFILFILA